jgi:hypothetical protein
MLQLLGYLSGIISLSEYPPYLRDIFRGTTKPQRASWFIWSVLGSIAFASQFAEGARYSLWMTGVQTLGVLTVFIISLRKGEGGLSKLDIGALVVAAVGLALWYITRTAAYALMFVIVADAAGTTLTVLKTYKNPGSETLVTWILASFAGIFAALAVGSWNFLLLAYPLYIFLANFSVVLAIFLGNRANKRTA